MNDNFILFKLFRVSGNNLEKSELKRTYYKLMLMYHPDKCRNDTDTNNFNHITQVIVKAYEMLQDDNTRELYNILGNKAIDISDTFLQSIKKAINLIAKAENTYEPEIITIHSDEDSNSDDEPMIIDEIPPRTEGREERRGRGRQERDDHGEWVEVCPYIRIYKHKRCTNTVKFKFVLKDLHISAWRKLDDITCGKDDERYKM